MSNKTEVAVELAGGKRLVFETGRMAKQASGAALVTTGETVVLATAVASPDPREGIDFFPLTVDYREYTYAGGRIPGGFIKREGRPSEKEILTARQIDRPIRPMFPDGFRNETQIIALVFSADKENDPDVIGINAAVAALALSDIPFGATLGAVRVGRVNGEFIINPTYDERSGSTVNIMVVGHKDGIVMIEAGAKGETEDVVLSAIEFAHAEIKKIVAGIEELVAKAGKPKRSFTAPVFDEAYYNDLKAKVGDRLKDALDTKAHGKIESYALIKQIQDELKTAVPAEDADGKKKVAQYYEILRERLFREQVTRERIRPDRRAFDEIRPISIETGVLPRTHGSSLFTRGETQALVTATLGTMDDAQRLESYEGEQKKNFMLHYNFPPFSVGETGRMTGVGRREVGHGALAERAITAVLPDESQYSIRIVSDILESNGSSSMASVCGASLALYDAGVEIKGAVAGVAMGLVKEGDDYAILTDIAGAEDHYGDMDFKVAGTRKGITALQMDIKIGGLTREILQQAMEQARQGRLFLLDKMDAELAGPRVEKSKYAPRIETLMIPTDKIRDLIGKGGATIRGIVEQTGAKIDVDDTGKVSVASADADGLRRAMEIIGNITAVPEVGKVYLGKVVRLAEFGAFVELFPGTDGLLHISEIAEHRVKEVKDELREGDQVMVKVLAIEGNRIKLSRKALIREQKAKLAQQTTVEAGPVEAAQSQAPAQAPAPAKPRHEFDEKQPRSNQSTILIEGGEDFDEDGTEEFDEDNEPNFNRAEGAPVAAGQVAGSGGGGAGRPAGGDGGGRNRRRRRRGGRPAGGGRQG
jgi:polyribonucleotide nucleotidyltransferase